MKILFRPSNFFGEKIMQFDWFKVKKILYWLNFLEIMESA